MYSSSSPFGTSTSTGYSDRDLSIYRHPTNSSPQSNPKEKQSELQSNIVSSMGIAIDSCFESSHRSTNHTVQSQYNPSDVRPTAPAASEPNNVREEVPPPSYYDAIHSQSYM